MSTQKELAITVFDRLVELETRNIAMSAILDLCYVEQQGIRQPLQWKESERQMRENQTTQGVVNARFSEIQRSILAATDGCPDALSLLALVAKGLV
jgi:hypothetical protein